MLKSRFTEGQNCAFRTFSLGVIYLIVLISLLMPAKGAAQNPHLKDSIRKMINQELRPDSLILKSKPDGTLKANDIFKKHNWTINITSKNQATQTLVTCRPDTIELANVTVLEMNAAFKVDTSLVGKTIALKYQFYGSVLMLAHSDTILKTGIYNKTDDEKASNREQIDFTHINLKDSVLPLHIYFRPDARFSIIKLDMTLEELSAAREGSRQQMIEAQDYYCLGYYYLAFGIVFMLVFLFSREKTENLYFALFCLCTAFSCISASQNTYLSSILFLFFMVFSFEFMSFFLAKVLKNKNKSKISLVVRLVIAAICFHPAILYNFDFFGEHFVGNLGVFETPLIVMLVFILLFCISFTSSVFYLIKGFRQKRWEAKTIVVVCCVALFFTFVVSIITSFFHDVPDFIDDLSGLGIYIYPLGAVIVLGRTTRLNQRKLLDQVVSIRQLSEENLTKEREKQHLLETQNTELENKVQERTIDIVRQKEELEIKKLEIELKNKAITDNINYAQRIQSAILPDIKLIYKALEDSFILFLPKDIVSGDFYAFAEKNDRVLIIAGDCTGHGVSGAFMSMIGSSLLNQIINEKGITEPALILNQLNTAVIEALKQSENESNDGMDISICSFGRDKRELQYAGANRPLWLIRAGEIQVYRPDKFPIGGLQMARNRAFTNTTIPLQKNDAIYIFTDGYADQFGGENSKKLMTAKFKELLLTIQHLDMRQQELHLKTFFDKWKGTNEQVDDVLLIGVRI